MDELQFPTINLNGTNPDRLALLYYDAAQAVENAHKLMQGIVHGRDYQHVGGLDEYKKAVEQMQERSKKLIEVYNDLIQLGDSCILQAR